MRLSVTEVPVGRAVGDAGIALPTDERVSRRHATLTFSVEGRSALLRDESRTGTFVEGRRISEATVHEGELIRAGDSFFLFRFEKEAPEAELVFPCGLVGDSPAMRAVRQTLALVAKSEASVLILGESGTGKELAAKALHEHSGRSGPFVPVNCGAIPEALAESQLFGHVAGAFTGARGEAPGFFRSAHGGTLFLDEIGELPLALQPKLLRAVEERAVVPVGATKAVACDVRIVAATNRDLTDPARFRGDLFARLSDFVVEVPPLRARREDVLPILAELVGATRADLDAELLEALLLHDYPHNARDLRRVATQLKLRGAAHAVWDVSLIDPLERFAPASPVPAAAPENDAEGSSAPPRRAGSDARDSRGPAEPEGAVPTREALIALLRTHRGVIADIARETGRSRKQVYRWLERHGLKLEEYRTSE